MRSWKSCFLRRRHIRPRPSSRPGSDTMRVVIVARTARRGWQLPALATGRAAHFERLGLAVTSLVLLLGLWLTYSAQTAEFDQAGRDLASGRLVNLNTVRKSSDLAPALETFDEKVQREAMASTIFSGVQRLGGRQRLEHVGGLASLSGLTTSDIVAVKPRLVVRTPREFRRRAASAVAVFMFAFWLAHAVRAYFRTIGDAVLLPAVQLLSGLSLMAMLAFRDPLRDMFAAG